MPYSGFDESHPQLQDEHDRPRGQKKKKPFRKPYNIFNMPPSLDAALERIDILEEEIISIEDQLEHAEMPHMSSEEFDEWRKQATKALSCKRIELNYLERFDAAWIRPGKDSPEILIEGKTEFGKAILAVRDISQAITKSYSPTQPGKRTKARKVVEAGTKSDRLKQLESWRLEIEESLNQLRGWGRFYKVPAEIVLLFKTPALEILAALHTEMLDIKASAPRIILRPQRAA